MDDEKKAWMRERLVQRRNDLQAHLRRHQDAHELARLLMEVDSALERLNRGTFGLCEVCHEPIEANRLMRDPFLRTCLDHLTAEERRTLEEDLDLAAKIQRQLLPRRDVNLPGWKIAYHYEPAGPVSGDYYDLISTEDQNGAFYLMLGDVSGKGIAASMLMVHLNAMFRSLIPLQLSSDAIVQRANQIFCESTLTTHYATLVFVHAAQNGVVELCNAGHCAPLWIRAAELRALDSNALPLGLFCEGAFQVQQVQLDPEDSIVFYTDGLTEALNDRDEEYGINRLVDLLKPLHGYPPEEVLRLCIEDLSAFRANTEKTDDLTILVLQRIRSKKD